MTEIRERLKHKAAVRKEMFHLCVRESWETDGLRFFHYQTGFTRDTFFNRIMSLWLQSDRKPLPILFVAMPEGDEIIFTSGLNVKPFARLVDYDPPQDFDTEPFDGMTDEPLLERISSVWTRYIAAPEDMPVRFVGGVEHGVIFPTVGKDMRPFARLDAIL